MASVNKQVTERDYEIEDLKSVLQSEHGRRFVARIIEISGVFRTSMTGNSHTFFNEGRRDIGNRILNDVIETCPDNFAQMMVEFRQHKQLFKERT